MNPGKKTCDQLKSIRVKLAEANGIDYTPHECDNEKACFGTCPLCEEEVAWLENELTTKIWKGESIHFDVLTDQERQWMKNYTLERGEECWSELWGNDVCPPRLMGCMMAPSDEQVLIERAGAYDIIKALQVLHKRGYGQLRLYSRMSPSGLCWRWEIYSQRDLKGLPLCEQGREDTPSVKHPQGSASDVRSNIDAEALADALLKEYTECIERGRGADPEYTAWYEQIAEAAERNVFPLAEQEYDTPDGWILGDGVIPYPPFENMGQEILSSEIAGLQFHHADDVWEELERGSELKLVREPRNKYDKRAVAVCYGDTKLGYIPRTNNEEIARLLDTKGPEAVIARVYDKDDKNAGSKSIDMVVFRNQAYKMPEAKMEGERMRVRFEDTEAEVISFSMEDTYGGLIEGTRACYSEHIQKDLRPEPGLVVMPSFCGSDSCKELLPCHFVLHARTDFEHRLCVQWFGRYPSGREPLCELIEQVTLSISFRENCRFVDIDEM